MTGNFTDSEMRAINRLWRRFLRPYTCDSTNNRLRQTLGPWTRPDLRNWPAYYDSSSQMRYQMVPPHPNATLGTSSTSWTYHPAGIECTRRFVAVSKNAASFQDSRPPSDAVPVTVLLDTPTLLRCSIPPMPLEPAHDAVRAPINATFADYVATLSLWERDLLAQRRRTALILPCANYCNRRTSTYLSQATAATRMTTALSAG
jgi:hypothetical protein